MMSPSRKLPANEVVLVASGDLRLSPNQKCWLNGLIREEDGAGAQPFAEVWHMTKPRDGSRGWVLAGIQQVQ